MIEVVRKVLDLRYVIHAPDVPLKCLKVEHIEHLSLVLIIKVLYAFLLGLNFVCFQYQ